MHTMNSLNDLKAQYERNIPYFELLQCQEWYSKRRRIISQDNNTCRKCGKKSFDDYKPKSIYRKGGEPDVIFVPINYELEEYIKKIPRYDFTVEISDFRMIEKEVKNPVYLQVHHTYYVLTRLPWEYKDEDLITLCIECHNGVHDSELIPVYKNELKKTEARLTPCSRCGGKGILKEYRAIENGICFKCRGAKYEDLIYQIDNV